MENAENLTFLYSLFPSEFELLEGKDRAESLDDLRGFAVNLYKDFFALCPMKYRLQSVDDVNKCTGMFLTYPRPD